MLYKYLGERVREARKRKNLTQTVLANASGISISFLGHIERGTRKASLETLIALCKALQVTPNELLRDSIPDDLIPDAKISQNLRHLIHQIYDLIEMYDRQNDI